MPKDLPGFYYDAEKNRYFPLKGPIPGSTRHPSSSSSSPGVKKQATKPAQGMNLLRRTRIRTYKLLLDRELYGNVIPLNKGKCNFKEEFLKKQASQPVVWKYQGTDKIVDSALDQTHIAVHRLEGQTETDVLVTGGINGSLSIFEVGKVGQQFDYGVKCMSDRVWPLARDNHLECVEAHGLIWKPPGASLQMSSSISCIKLSGKHSPCTFDNGPNIQHALITTLGSESSGGSVYVLNLAEPLDFNINVPGIRRRIHEVASFNCTIWTADCNSSWSRAVIGTNLGAALVDLETGMASWVCRCRSDVLAQQLDQSGNVALCGLRNGAIVAVDVRERREQSSARLFRIPYSPIGRAVQNSTKQWFKLRGNIYPSRTIYMPSSISCLVSLRVYDQYFLASSMDGSVKLYDHRLVQRGAVQSYEGHVNSHTRIQLGVDPSERFVMSGGEDNNLRIWSIKSGELLFEDNFSNSVLSTVCWRRTGSRMQSYEDCLSGGAWLGSQEELFHMRWT